MFIDYIYLILILVLIGAILFFIYLSYEYRTQTENFINPIINEFNQPPPSNYDGNINAYQKKIDNVIYNLYNSQLDNISIDYNNTLSKITANKNVLQDLKSKENELKPQITPFPPDKLIKTIKSNYNSQQLSLFSNDMNKYGILVNSNCFTVNGLCKDEYCLQKCQNSLYTTDSQKFYTDRVASADDVARIMQVSKDKINSKNIYPFNIFRSSVNDKCLNINDDGLTVENCNLNDIHQQWKISPDENICLLT